MHRGVKCPVAHVLLGAALLLGQPAWAGAETFGYKGLELGSSIVQVATNPRYECRASNAPAADTICSLRPRERETIAGAPLTSLFLFYGEGRLTSIALHLEEKHFARVVDALAGKYGRPTLRAAPVRNLKGAAFENRIYTWRNATDSLMAERYAARIDQSAIRYAADDLIRRMEQRRAAVAKDPRQDL